MFKLLLETEDDAFQPDPKLEIVRILHRVVRRLEAGEIGGLLQDSNGNLCGRFRLIRKDRDA